MDFSTVDRALTSLSRRQPALPDEVLNLSTHLLELLSSENLAENDDYARSIIRLIELGSASTSSSGTSVRWEPLAVGLRLIVDYLEKRTTEIPRSAQLSAATDEAGDYNDEDEGTGLGTGGGGVYAEGPRIPKTAAETAAAAMAQKELLPTSSAPVFQLMTELPTILNTNVEHAEPRVRSLVAQAVGAYARYATSLLNWLDSSTDITDPSERNKLQLATEHAQVGRRNIHATILLSLKSHLDMKEPSRENNPSAASDGALDDTTGWRALETNLHALASYVDGCVGKNNAGGGSYINEEAALFDSADTDVNGWFLAGLQHCCVVHVNRHVRAAAAAVLGVLIKSCMRSRDPSHEDLLVEEDSPFRLVLKETLKGTLADNWSQVRMAGSVLCRRFVQALLKIYKSRNGDNEDGVDEDLTLFECAAGDLVPMLLPRMCLNRFYLAQGVKLYSQETWKEVFGSHAHAADEDGLHSSGETRGGGGLGAVARNAAPLCRYYSKMCDADNHAVREAACQGVAELAQKVGQHPLYADYLSPYVNMLLQALLMCFHDESWPVRDEACLACGTFCIAYAEECKPELTTLFERWTEQLTDQIWSVREDAAVALGDAVTAYGPEMLEKVLAVIRKSLPAAKDQPPMTREEYKKLQNDVSAHTGNQVYSCGSLAPKLRKGGAGRIGCSSCLVDRPKQPWEATDGALYLLRELCTRFPNSDGTEREDVVLGDNILLPLMTELADVARLSHYPQSDDLRTTLFKQLPQIAEAMGKRRFKGLYLDLFIELISKNLNDRHGSGASQLSIHAAGQCCEDIAKLIGFGIMRGRLEAIGCDDAFDSVMEERKREQSMIATQGHFIGREAFSPFGPPVGSH